jgi:hypothetical protein
MADEQDPPQVFGHLFGDLTPAERQELARRALENQEVFDALGEFAEHRETLQDPNFRADLIDRLRAMARRGWRTRLREWATSSAGRRWVTGCCAAALIAIVSVKIWRPAPPVDETLTIVTSANAELSSFFQLPLRNPAHSSLEIDGSVFHPGDVVRAKIHLTGPGAVFAIRREVNSRTYLVFPIGSATADQLAGEVRFFFDPVSPTEDVKERRTYTLRVLILPAGVDIRSQSIEWSRLAGLYSVLDRQYDVAP